MNNAYTDRIIDYLKIFNSAWENKNYAKDTIEVNVFCFIVFAVGLGRGGIWMMISTIAILTEITITILACLYSKKNMTYKKRCWLVSFYAILCIFPFSMVIFMLYEMQFGINFGLILFYYPIILVPIVHNWQKDKLFKSGKYFTLLRIYSQMFGSALGSVLVAGTYLCFVSNDISKDLPVAVAILCALFVNVMFSYAFESFLALRYLRYCEKNDVCIDNNL